MKFEKHTITNFHIQLDKNTFNVELFKEKSCGSTLYWIADHSHEIIWYSSDHSEEKIRSFLEKLHYNFEEALENIYSQIGGIFEIFIFDKKKRKLFIVNDLYGVNGSYCLTQKEQFNFFLNFQNFQQFQAPLAFDVVGMQAHFAFGYQVKPFPLPYKNITKLEGGKLFTFDAELTKKSKKISFQFSEKEDSYALKDGFNTNEKLFFGVTAGKDSLALLSQIEEGNEQIKTGNFGHVYSADVLQGKEIAVNLDLSYQYATLCDEFEFEYYALKIAQISGGLATASYVDMLKFVAETIPENYSYVMGEAGECVRMFFADEKNLAKALHNYLTPKEFLENSFIASYDVFLKSYPENVSTEITKNYEADSIASTLINFYRNGRLPGNFGNRHKIISAYRNKVTPFLHENFIKQTHNLPHKRYQFDKIHEHIIYEGNQDLLQYFKNPIIADQSVQDWNARLADEVGKTLYHLLAKHIHALKTVLDTQKVLQLAQKQQKNPDRGLYFLFRVVSMAIFVDNINNAVAPCEKKF